MIKSQRCSPSGSRSSFDSSIAVSAISLYWKFDGQAGTVVIHSLAFLVAYRVRKDSALTFLRAQ